MASPTTPYHGRYGALYALRPNGFSGIGLNDLSWGAGYTGAATAYFEVEIDHTAASPDSFRWRVDGGAWTENVDITGAEQTLSDGQKITFGAIDGHTVGDKWTIGNLKAEGTSESGVEAQVTTAGHRLLNPNAPPTWTDSGGKVVERVNFTNGKATFSGNVGTVTLTGNNGYIPSSALRKVAYLLDWNVSFSLEMADKTAQGDTWKTALPGNASGSGGANAYFIASETMYRILEDSILAGDKYFLLELFNYDPDADQSGDRIRAWVTLTAFSLTNSIGDVVKESVNFQVNGEVSFLANS